MSSQERMSYAESSGVSEKEMPRVAKSLDYFKGDLNEGVSFSFNDAVIAAQKEMGSTFYLTRESFGEIMPSGWATRPAGEVLALFDDAYETWVLKQMGHTTEEIALHKEETEIGRMPSTIETEEDVQAILGEFDERFGDNPDAPPREEYEDFVWQAFLDSHHELSEPHNPGVVTIEMAPSAEDPLSSADNERHDAQWEFQQLLLQHPELEELREDFLTDLETYIHQKYDEVTTS